MNMTQALAKSNNLYFEELGRELGFERVRHYATQFGLGELAGYNIPGEQLGVYPDQPIPESEGGVGRMCSFGQGVSLTPLQLGAFVAAIANGGTLYYLQHPTTPEEVAAFQPKVKRTLDIARYVPDLEDGMAGAVEYGTARRLRANFRELPVFGKTGTCSDNGTRFGWFASYSESPQGGLVTVFFLEGGRPTFGPRAAELTGAFYAGSLGPRLLRGKEPGSPKRTRSRAGARDCLPRANSGRLRGLCAVTGEGSLRDARVREYGSEHDSSRCGLMVTRRESDTLSGTSKRKVSHLMSPGNEIRLKLLLTAPLDAWVALSQDESRIVATGNDYDQVARRADEAGEADPVILKTPPAWAQFSV